MNTRISNQDAAPVGIGHENIIRSTWSQQSTNVWLRKDDKNDSHPYNGYFGCKPRCIKAGPLSRKEEDVVDVPAIDEDDKFLIDPADVV